MNDNSKLNKLKINPNDEAYTYYESIEKELQKEFFAAMYGQMW